MHIDINCFTKESDYILNVICAMSQGQIVDDYAILGWISLEVVDFCLQKYYLIFHVSNGVVLSLHMC